jgi:protein-L-isoaspartate O-methyltransferase
MLSASSVRPRQRVLEIGTGSGQLTALLCALVGPAGAVLTVDSEAALIEGARSRFTRFYPQAPVTFRHADAGALDLGEQEFDLVISTASCWPIPISWLDHLAPGGTICTELRGDRGGAMAVLHERDRIVAGDFHSWYGAFMPLREPGPEIPVEMPFGFGEYEAKRAPADGLTLDAFRDGDFKWFCQLQLPGAKLIYYAVDPDTVPMPYLVADGLLDAVRIPGPHLGGDLVSYGNSADLLDRLLAAWADWQGLGRPERSDYHFTADGDGTQTVSLRHAGRTWAVRGE